MNKNTKLLSIEIENESKLNIIRNTFAFRKYFYNINELKVGINIIKTNHYNYNSLLNNQLLGMAKVTEYFG